MIQTNNPPDVVGILKAKHRNLAILRVLEGEPGYCSNELLLGGYLAAVGLTSSREELRNALQELSEQGAISIDRERTLIVTTITETDVGIAKGLKQIDIVLRPGPGCPY